MWIRYKVNEFTHSKSKKIVYIAPGKRKEKTEKKNGPTCGILFFLS